MNYYSIAAQNGTKLCTVVYHMWYVCIRFLIQNLISLYVLHIIVHACRKRGGWGALAPPVFGRTVNPISTRGADYAHYSTTSLPGFSDLATAL